MTPNEILQSITFDKRGRAKVPKELKLIVLPKSPNPSHCLNKTGTFSCPAKQNQELKSGKYDYIAYYDSILNEIYLLDANEFRSLPYVEFKIKTNYGREFTKCNFVGYVGGLIKSGNFIEKRVL